MAPKFKTRRIEARIENGKIFLSFEFDETTVNWARSFANRTYDPESKRWAIDATQENAELVAKSAPTQLFPDRAFIKLLGREVNSLEFCLPTRHPGPFDLTQPEGLPFELWEHQAAAFNWNKDKEAFMLAASMGTGKTPLMLALLWYWHKTQGCQAYLALAPKVVQDVWAEQNKQFFGDQFIVLSPDQSWTVRKKIEWLGRRIYGIRQAKLTKPFLVCLNLESCVSEDMRRFLAAILWDCTILDESHRWKSPTGVLGKFARKHLRRASIRRVTLTGTPCPNDPVDLYSQFGFMDPSIFPDTLTAFKARYTLLGHYGEVVGWARQAELNEKFLKLAFPIDSSVLTLPPATHSTIQFDLCGGARNAHDEFWNQLATDIAGNKVTLQNALVKIIRCQQVTSGFVEWKDEDAERRRAVFEPRREQLVEELLGDFHKDEKICIFCRFTQDLDAISRIAERLNRPYGEVSGRRKDLAPGGRYPDEKRILALQVQSGGVGIDLTASSAAVLYSIDWSAGNYQQMLRRILRPGQESPCRFFHIQARDTIDGRIENAVKNKIDLVASIIGEIEKGIHS